MIILYLIIDFSNFELINNYQFFSQFMIFFILKIIIFYFTTFFNEKYSTFFTVRIQNEKNHYSNVLRTTSIVKKRSSNYKVSINTWRIPSGKFYRVRIKDTKFVILRLHFQQPLFITVNENDKSRLESRGFYPVLWAELYNGSYALRGLW